MSTPDMFRLAIDGSGLARPRAGVGIYTREILSAFSSSHPGHPMTVFLPPGLSLPPDLGHLDAEPIPGPRFWGRHVRWPHRLRHLAADLYFGPAGQLPLGSVGAPSVITIHDLAIYRNPAWFPPRQPLSTRLVVPRSLRRADAIIAVSANTALDLQDLFNIAPERIHLVPHGVTRTFQPLDRATLEPTRARLRLPDRFILFVGTIEPRKNLGTLIEAVTALPGSPPLVVVGNWGWGFESVRRQIESGGDRVRLLGDLEPGDLPALYNLAAVLAHPAWYEGFGLTPLEAMACGTPVVVSDRSSLPEVVGEAALKVPPDDVAGWTSALERVLTDPALAGRLRAAGLARAKQFGWDRSAKLTWQVIEQVLER